MIMMAKIDRDRQRRDCQTQLIREMPEGRQA